MLKVLICILIANTKNSGKSENFVRLRGVTVNHYLR